MLAVSDTGSEGGSDRVFQQAPPLLALRLTAGRVNVVVGNDHRNVAVAPDANTNVSSLTNLSRSRRTIVPSSWPPTRWSPARARNASLKYGKSTRPTFN